MSVDPEQLVKDQLDPVMTLDPTIEAAIPRAIEAQIALQGYPVAISERQAVYISILATKALIPRLLLKFMQEVQRAKGSDAEAEFADAIKFLEALQKELTAQANKAAAEADPEDVDEKPGPSWPTSGMRRW
jgi:hypothetical protein